MADHSPHSIPQEPGRWSAITLAVLMHAMLFVFLSIGIRWQSQKPATVEAEVWNLETKEAAPLPQPHPQPPVQPIEEPRPKPQPKVEQEKPVEKKPDIAMEHEKKLKEKRAKEEAEREEEKLKLKQEQARLEKKKAEAQAKKKEEAKMAELAAKLRQDFNKRETAGSGGAGDAAKSQGLRGDPDYVGKLAAKIKMNTTYMVPPDMQGNPSVEFTVELFPDGSVQRIKKLKSSGLPKFDEAVERAIKLSEPFPPNKGADVRSFTFSQTPKPKE